MKFAPNADQEYRKEQTELIEKRLQKLTDALNIAIAGKMQGNENAFDDALKLVYGEKNQKNG